MTTAGQRRTGTWIAHLRAYHAVGREAPAQQCRAAVAETTEVQGCVSTGCGNMGRKKKIKQQSSALEPKKFRSGASDPLSLLVPDFWPEVLKCPACTAHHFLSSPVLVLVLLMCFLVGWSVVSFYHSILGRECHFPSFPVS